MKKIVISAIVSSALMLSVTGCGDNNSKSNATVTKQEKKVSIEDRKKAFNKKIESYKEYGFDINQTSPKSYLLTVKEPKKSVELFLKIFSLNLSVDESDKQDLEKLLDGSRFSVDVDWDKYVSNQKDSVEVNALGKDSDVSSDPIAKMLQEKKVGAYLTYNGNDELKKIDFKDIDDVLKNGNEKAHIKLSNAFVDVEKAPTSNSTQRKYTINGGEFNIEFTDELNTTTSMGYKNLKCDIDKSNAYLGEQECKIPTISISMDKGSKEQIDITMSDTEYNYKAVSKNNKVNEDLSFSIKAIDTNNNMHLKGLKFSGLFANMDEAVIKEYMSILESPSKDNKKDMAKLLSLAGKMYQNGVTLKYDTAVDSIDINSDEINFALSGYSGHGEGALDKNINYDEKSVIKSLVISDATNKNNKFEVDNFRFGYGISDMYNFIPKMMDILSVASTETNTTKIDNVVQKDGLETAQKLVNQGFGIHIKPLGMDKAYFSDSGDSISVGKSDFELDVRLLQNQVKVDINNPMMPMMLLSYLKADGKLVIPIKDLQTLSKRPEFAMLGMLMMMAKIEGENAVFVLKYENGKLLVNNQPVM